MLCKSPGCSTICRVVNLTNLLPYHRDTSHGFARDFVEDTLLYLPSRENHHSRRRHQNLALQSLQGQRASGLTRWNPAEHSAPRLKLIRLIRLLKAFEAGLRRVGHVGHSVPALGIASSLFSLRYFEQCFLIRSDAAAFIADQPPQLYSSFHFLSIIPI